MERLRGDVERRFSKDTLLTNVMLYCWTVMKAGGHFVALEEPEALAEDVRAVFRGLRG